MIAASKPWKRWQELAVLLERDVGTADVSLFLSLSLSLCRRFLSSPHCVASLTVSFTSPEYNLTSARLYSGVMKIVKILLCRSSQARTQSSPLEPMSTATRNRPSCCNSLPEALPLSSFLPPSASSRPSGYPPIYLYIFTSVYLCMKIYSPNCATMPVCYQD